MCTKDVFIHRRSARVTVEPPSHCSMSMLWSVLYCPCRPREAYVISSWWSNERLNEFLKCFNADISVCISFFFLRCVKKHRNIVCRQKQCYLNWSTEILRTWVPMNLHLISTADMTNDAKHTARAHLHVLGCVHAGRLVRSVGRSVEWHIPKVVFIEMSKTSPIWRSNSTHAHSHVHVSTVYRRLVFISYYYSLPMNGLLRLRPTEPTHSRWLLAGTYPNTMNIRNTRRHVTHHTIVRVYCGVARHDRGVCVRCTLLRLVVYSCN